MLAAFCLDGPAEKDQRVRFELRKVRKPTLVDFPPGSVLIRTVAASICGTDLWGKGGCCDCDWRKPLDFLSQKRSLCGGSGHEIIGVVEQSVKPCSLRVGQRVLAMSPLYISYVKDLCDRFKEATGKEASSVLPDMGGFCQFFISHSCCCLPVPSESPSDAFDP